MIETNDVPILELRNITKFFDKKPVLRNVSLKVKSGEFFSVLGYSGSGKTTLLKIIAGFEECDTGEVVINGKVVNGVNARYRNVNTIFQDYALFENMTAWDNVAFGLRAKGVHEEEVRKSVTMMMEILEMSEHASKFPDQMSGGQKQRVAIARALVNKPDILLLDEPLSALDARLRQKTLYDMQKIQADLGVCFIFVTHDQNDAMEVSDSIAVLENGKVSQIGDPVELYCFPKNLFVASFVGENNIISVKALSHDLKTGVVKASGINDTNSVFSFIYNSKSGVSLTGRVFSISIRPERVTIEKSLDMEQDTGDRDNFIFGRVVEEGYRGSFMRLGASTESGIIKSIRFSGITGDNIPELGDRVKATWDKSSVRVLLQ